MVKATGRLEDPGVLDAVQERVLKLVDGKTAAEVGRHTRDAVRSLDPDGAQKQAREAREQCDVVLYPSDDEGVADVVATLPVEDAALVKAGVDAYAMAAKQAGDPRRVGVLRSEGLTRMASSYHTGSDLGRAPRSGSRAIEIGVTVDLATALGHRDLPAEVPGMGVVPREVVADLIAHEQAAQVCATYVRSTGRGTTARPIDHCA